MALHKDSPKSLYGMLDRTSAAGEGMARPSRYVGTIDMSKNLPNCWFSSTHMLPWLAIPLRSIATGEHVCGISSFW